ncbi:MAG: hypothetical protein KGR26_15420 [Cyanobacteria bacterium REEB65]|nr:hypothetical protein [Cyanobacteria bacterium REEB65]
MLIKVKRLNYSNLGYAPLREDALVNTEEIVAAVKCEARGDGPFLQLTFRDGKQMTLVGRVDDVLALVNSPTPSPRSAACRP